LNWQYFIFIYREGYTVIIKQIQCLSTHIIGNRGAWWPRGQLRRAIAEVKQRWSVIRWVTKNLLSQAPSCFRRHFKPLVPAAFAVVSTHQPALARVVCYGPISLCIIHEEGLCPSSGAFNRQMTIICNASTKKQSKRNC
jgi:hypothetical protein